MSNFHFRQFGLEKEGARKIVQEHFKKNADILIGIDDPEVNQLVEILVEAFIDIIDKNNKEISNNIQEYLAEK